jgi:hypothetical protein
VIFVDVFDFIVLDVVVWSSTDCVITNLVYFVFIWNKDITIILLRQLISR